MKKVIEVEAVTIEHAFTEAIFAAFHTQPEYKDECKQELELTVESIVNGDNEDSDYETMCNYIAAHTTYEQCIECGMWFDYEERIFNSEKRLCICCELDLR